MKPSDIHEEVEIIEERGEYFIKPSNEHYQFYKSAVIPKRLFDLYLENRDIKTRIKRYFRTPKDKKMTVARYHVNEGEVHKMTDDGPIITKKP